MKILQLPRIGNGGRLGNCLFTIASTIGIALRNGYTPRFPANWKYRDRFNIPDEWFGEIEPAGQVICESSYKFTVASGLFADVVNIEHSYLQSPKYWQGYEAEIRQYLTPKGAAPGTKEGVAIHYRRGDYVDNPNYFQLPMSYYISNYDRHFKGLEIAAFSDDPEFIKLHHPLNWQHDNDPVTELAEM